MNTSLRNDSSFIYHFPFPLDQDRLELQLTIERDMVQAISMDIDQSDYGIDLALDIAPQQQMLPYNTVHVMTHFEIYLAQLRALEKANRIILSKYAENARQFLLLLTRIANHLNYFATLGYNLNIPGLFSMSVKNYRNILAYLSGISDSDTYHSLLKFGGLRQDFPPGCLEKVENLILQLRALFPVYRKFLLFNPIFKNQAINTGVISWETAQKYHLSGPNLLACKSLASNPRLKSGKTGKRGTPGDCWQRVWIRYTELENSTTSLDRLVTVLVGQLPELAPPKKGAIRTVKGSYRLTGAKGDILVTLLDRIDRFRYQTRVQLPTAQLLPLIPEMLTPQRLSDISLILASLDLTLPLSW